MHQGSASVSLSTTTAKVTVTATATMTMSSLTSDNGTSSLRTEDLIIILGIGGTALVVLVAALLLTLRKLWLLKRSPSRSLIVNNHSPVQHTVEFGAYKNSADPRESKYTHRRTQATNSILTPYIVPERVLSQKKKRKLGDVVESLSRISMPTTYSHTTTLIAENGSVEAHDEDDEMLRGPKKSKLQPNMQSAKQSLPPVPPIPSDMPSTPVNATNNLPFVL